MARLEIAARSLESVAELTDTSVAEAHESKRLADAANQEIAPLHALLDFWRGLRWLVPAWPSNRLDKIKDETTRLALAELFSDRYNLVAVTASGHIGGRGEARNVAISAANELLERTRQLARREHFFHWQTAFPTVWKHGVGGFDALIGNPPWDRIKLQQVEWFAERKPEIALQARAADRKRLIAREQERNTPLWRDFLLASDAAEAGARVVRECGDYPLLSGGDINLYSLFVERAQELARPGGIVGLLTPSGIAADKGASAFFRTLTAPDEPVAPASSRLLQDAGKAPRDTVPAGENAGATDGCRLAALYDFENRNNPGGSFFPDVDSRFKFCALIFGGKARRFAQSRCAFYLHDVAELADPQRSLTLTGEDFALLNPNTGAAPIFRCRRDAEITIRIYRNHPVLVNRSGGKEQRAWPVRYVTMFHMTNDSGLFLTRTELEKRGFEPAALNRWVKNGSEAVPLYEGKMVQRYDHRAADVVVNTANLHRAAQQEVIQEAVKEQPDRYPAPQYWVQRDAIESYELPSAVLAFKDVTAPTNVRTMIAALVPATAFGNTLPILVLPPRDAVLLLANLNSFAFDFLSRQKVQGQHLNWYILEQLPVIAPANFEQTLGGMKLANFIRAEVLALSYTAHDLAPFARDLGYVDADGEVQPPFTWNPEDRAQRMARLDALFMHLYGMDESDADYILSTFPIVREQDMKAHGCFRTRDLILAQLARIQAGTFNPAESAPPA
jgi:hypothetical protein